MKKLKQWFLTKLFRVSDYPVLFRDLLEANALFNDKMLVDPAKLNFNFRYLNTYLIYALFCLIILIPLILITHAGFVIMDFHFSIIGAILVTALIFVGFDVFKVYSRKLITKELIKRAWRVHFPHFTYEKYNKLVQAIYKQALKEQISRAKLEQFVLEQIIFHSR